MGPTTSSIQPDPTWTSSVIRPLFGAEYADYLRSVIDSARFRVWITMFVWRWYPNDPGSPIQLINQALIAAQRRGVDVRALVNLSGALKYFQEARINVRFYHGAGVLHAKAVMIDSGLVIVGSHNMTMNALTKNLEASVALYSPEVCKRFEKFFDVSWQ